MDMYGKTDKGMIRNSNQDAFYCGQLSDSASFIIVCDGIGGANGGETASSMAVQVISDTFKRLYNTQYQRIDIENMIQTAVNSANKDIYVYSLSDEKLKGMGTTCVCAILTGDGMYIGNVGDSRAYAVSQKGIEKITKDHSIVQQLVDIGEISEAEARIHPQRNIITRSLGVDANVEIDLFYAPRSSADFLVLCSDGLYSLVEKDEIHAVLSEGPAPVQNIQGVCEQLVKTANERGGVDNITVAIAKLTE